MGHVLAPKRPVERSRGEWTIIPFPRVRDLRRWPAPIFWVVKLRRRGLLASSIPWMVVRSMGLLDSTGCRLWSGVRRGGGGFSGGAGRYFSREWWRGEEPPQASRRRKPPDST